MGVWRSIRGQALALGILPLAFLALVLTVVAILQFESESTARWVRHSDDVLSAAQRINDAFVPIQRSVSDYVRTGKPRFLRTFDAQGSRLPALTAELRKLVQDNPDQETRARSISSIAGSALEFEREYLSLVTTGRHNEAAQLERSARARAITDTWYRQLAAFNSTEVLLKAERWSNLAFTERALDWVLGLGAIAGILLTLLAARRVGSRIVERLERLAKNARRLQSGEDVAPGVPGDDEIADLDHAFHEMAAAVRQREAQLEKYRLLSEQARDVILFVRPTDGRIMEANTAASATYGYAPSELIGLNARDLRAPETLDKLEAQLDQARRTGFVFETVHRRKDGSTFPVEVTAQSAQVGSESLIVSIVRDITERRLVQEELHAALKQAVEASRLKSEFVATMSHEIRTPMNAVIGMTELLLTSDLDEDQRRSATVVRDAGEALLHLLNDILDFSKIEAKGIELEYTQFTLLPLIENITAMFAPQAAQKKGVALMSYVDSAIPPNLFGDAARLRQVFVNIAGNALKFTQHGSIVVSAHLIKQTADIATIKLSVRDTGIGIAPDMLDGIFEAFRQADGSTTRTYGGTGLGLAISKRLVESMGGSISVTSAPGKGSTFSFTLDLKHAGESSNVHVLEGMRALIVDDDAISREVFAEYFTSWRMRGETASDAAAAYRMMEAAALEGAPYEIAVVDFAMPQMDGIEFGRLVRSNPALAATRLIMVTAYDKVERGRAAIAAGFSAFLTKPIRQSQLFDCIANASHPIDEAATADVPEHEITPGLRILLAEDNAVNRDVALRQLRKLGYAAEAVDNGRQAIDAVARDDFDIVLMDCQMPVVDGFEATRAIRRAEVRTGGRIRIIAMTANALAEDREHCLAAGMDDYIAKPVTLADLQAAIARTPVRTLDLSRLRELFDGNRAEIVVFLKAALLTLDRTILKLENAPAPGERLAAAHELRGAAGNIGALELSQIAAEAETLLRAGEPIEDILTRLRRAYAALSEATAMLGASLEPNT